MTNIAIVGDKWGTFGISGKLFSSLGANNINRIIAQGASERNISILIDKILKSIKYNT